MFNTFAQKTFIVFILFTFFKLLYSQVFAVIEDFTIIYCNSTNVPVSYTHLMVIVAQKSDFIFHLYRFWFVLYMICSFVEWFLCLFYSNCMSVSYTHLDVYKRQS